MIVSAGAMLVVTRVVHTLRQQSPLRIKCVQSEAGLHPTTAAASEPHVSLRSPHISRYFYVKISGQLVSSDHGLFCLPISCQIFSEYYPYYDV